MIKKILIVDDSNIARKMLRSCIPKDREYEIHEAVNGLEGIEKFKSISPDITFMDLTMPVLDGYKTIPQLRQLNPDTIIIVTTADVQPKSIADVMALGVFTFLKKPAKPQSIQDVIEQAEVKLKSIAEQK